MDANDLFSDAELQELQNDNSIDNPPGSGGDDGNPNRNPDDNNPDDNNPDDNNPDDNKGDDTKGNDNPSDDEPTTVDTIINEFGLELEENEVIEDSIDGLKTVIDKVAEKASTQAITKVFEKYPLAGDLVKHLQEGLTIESFLMEKKAVDYSKVEIPSISDEATDDENEAVVEKHKEIITESLRAKGATQKEIDRFIKASVEENSTEEDAKEALKELSDKQAEIINQKKLAEKAEYDRQVKEAQDTIKTIVSTVESGVIGEFKIPKADLAAFKDFLVKFDENGNSPRDLRNSELTLEQSLILDYILFKDFKVAGLEKKTGLANKQESLDKNKNRIVFKSSSSKDTNGEDDADKILAQAFNSIGQRQA